MNWKNVLMIGGAVCACLLPTPSDWKDRKEEYYRDVSEWSGSDIDLCFYGLEKDQVIPKINEIHKAIVAANPSVPVTVISNRESVTFMRCYPYRNIQIMGSFESVKEILFDVDIDCTAIGYDGDNVVMIPRSLHAIQTRTNIADKEFYGVRGCPNYEKRLLKYVNRGFAIFDHGLSRYFISDSVLAEPSPDDWKFKWHYQVRRDNAGAQSYPGIGLRLLLLAERYNWVHKKLLSLNNTYALPYGPTIGISKIIKLVRKFSAPQRTRQDGIPPGGFCIEGANEFETVYPRNNFDGYTHYYSPPVILHTIAENTDDSEKDIQLSGNHSGFLVPDWYAGLDPNKKYMNCWYRGITGKSKEQFKSDYVWSDLFTTTRESDTDISIAYSEGIAEKNWKFVEQLIDLGFNPSQKGKRQWGSHSATVLLTAIGSDNLELADKLLEYGAALDEVDGRGYGALHYALSAHSVDSLEFLQQNNWNFKSCDFPKIVKYYLSNHTSKPKPRYLDFLLGRCGKTSEHKFEIVKAILQYNKPENLIDFYFEQQFAQKKTGENSENLIAIYLSDNREINTIDANVIRNLHSKGVSMYNVDSDGNNALTRAFGHCKFSFWFGAFETALKSLSVLGIPLNAANKNKHHFLFMCAQRDILCDYTKYLKKMVLTDKSGIKLEDTDINGETVLSLAVKNNLIKLAYALARDFNGMKHETTIKKLLEMVKTKQPPQGAVLARALLKQFAIPIPSDSSNSSSSSNNNNNDQMTDSEVEEEDDIDFSLYETQYD